MKICMIIPFKYNWDSHSSVKSTYELLQILGHNVTLFNLNKKPSINYNNYNQVWLMGSGTKLEQFMFDCINIPVIAFGLSDPNLYSQDHMQNSDIYCCNDLQLYNKIKHIKPVIYNPTSCDRRFHKNLNLEKTTDILMYGVGKHKFIPNRNEIVNKLRYLGFKIKIFGRNWNRHEDTYGFIDGDQLIKEINEAHLILDITNQTTALGRRIFESSCCGTPVLTCDREDVRQLFFSGHEILTYNNFENIVSTLNHVFKNPKTLKQIGLNAQQRCHSTHDISIRVQQLLKNIKEIKL